MLRFLRIDLMVRIHPQLNYHLESEEKSPAHCDSRRMNHEVWSRREEGPGHCSISKKLLSVQISTFDIYVCINTYIYINIYILRYIYKYIYIYIFIYIYIYIYIYTY